MNGEYGGGFINQKLTTDLDELFDADFYSRLKQPDQELQFKQAIAVEYGGCLEYKGTYAIISWYG